jgi:hypothetical protein
MRGKRYIFRDTLRRRIAARAFMLGLTIMLATPPAALAAGHGIGGRAHALQSAKAF